MPLVLVRGTGDIASGVAHALYRAGYSVVMHDTARPAHSRRGMAYVDALYEGVVEVEGVLAKRARTLPDLTRMIPCRRAVPVLDLPLDCVIGAAHPEIVVDARMRKRDRPESQRGLAPLTIGLGPNFAAGVNADVAVETAWGDALGAVLWSGQTLDLAGEPQDIGGHARDRYVYAPVAGDFSTSLNVGDLVVQGQEVARIGDNLLRAPLSGILRGLTHDGASVVLGTKVVEVDPRGSPDAVFHFGERAQRIAAGVLAAVRGRVP